MYFRLPPALLLSILAIGALFSSCHREERPDLTPDLNRTKAELEETRRKLGEAERFLAAKDDALALTASDLDTTKNGLAAKEQALLLRDAELRAVRAEIEALKKRDSLVFGEIRALQEQGRNVIALSRYQQFVKDYPKSPLVSNATAAVAELTEQSKRDAQRHADLLDPKRQERETLRLVSDGLLTPKELAPMLKKKTRAQVLSLLGSPNHVLPDSNEIGYADRATNPATGRKGMLIISFDAGSVSALRVDYAGQKFTP